MREIKFRAKPNKAYFFESDNVPTTDGFVFGTPDTRMLNVPGAEKWRKEHEMVDQPSIVAMTRDGWPYSSRLTMPSATSVDCASATARYRKLTCMKPSTRFRSINSKDKAI